MPHFLIATTNDQAMRDIGFPLVEAGHQVFLASNGQEALQAIAENAFDVLIIGVRLGTTDCLDIINIAEAVSFRQRWLT
jgi:DNA-binding response OmpR family regulator